MSHFCLITILEVNDFSTLMTMSREIDDSEELAGARIIEFFSGIGLSGTLGVVQARSPP